MVEPTEDDPNDEPTPDSPRLEPTLERPTLDPTVESDRLDPTVERCREEPTAEDDSLLNVDSPIEGPARPVPPMAKPAGPDEPMSWRIEISKGDLSMLPLIAPQIDAIELIDLTPDDRAMLDVNITRLTFARRHASPPVRLNGC